MILTQEYSRVAGITDPDDRAWLISPSGDIHPCGGDHETYIYEHPQEFEGEFTGLLSSYALVNSGWTRVGVIGGVFFVHIKDMLTARNLSILQDLAKETSIPYKQVQIHKDSGSSMYFKPEEFESVSLKDVNRRGVAHYANRKQASSTTRAWMISPQGEVHDCGSGEHEDYVVDHMKEFGGHGMYYLREEGWIQVGVFENNNFYFESLDLLSPTNLNIIQRLARQTQIPYSKVEVHVDETGMKVFTKEEFQLATLKDINRRGLSHYSSKQAALPHSRSLLRHTDLEELSYPLQKSFSLLGLEDQYKDMSLNQISSKLRTHETLLEDETGWTSDELIRDLNQFLE